MYIKTKNVKSVLKTQFRVRVNNLRAKSAKYRHRYRKQYKVSGQIVQTPNDRITQNAESLKVVNSHFRKISKRQIVHLIPIPICTP